MRKRRIWNSSPADAEAEELDDLFSDAQSDEPEVEISSTEIPIIDSDENEELSESYYHKKLTKFRSFSNDLLSALQSGSQRDGRHRKEAPPVNRKVMTDNARRFATALNPYKYYFLRMKGLMFWDNFYQSLLLSLVYWYCVMYRCFLKAFFMWAIGMLSRAYLRRKGYLPDPTTKKSSSEPSSIINTLRQAKQVIAQIQHWLGILADVMERFSNLVSFRTAKSSRIYGGFVVLLVAIAIIPLRTLWTIFQIWFYFKFFILEAIYHHFPDLKLKYAGDSFFSSLPTHKKVMEQELIDATDRPDDFVETDHDFDSEDDVIDVLPESKGRTQLKPNHIEQLSRFGISSNELVGSWMAADVSERQILKIKRGRIVLTKTHFAFLRANDADSLVMPVSAIVEVARSKPVGFLPKKSFALEIHVDHSQLTPVSANSLSSTPPRHDGVSNAPESSDIHTHIYAVIPREEIYSSICKVTNLPMIEKKDEGKQ